MRRGLIVTILLLVAPTAALASPSCSLKTSGFTNTDATSYATSSITLQANHLYLIFATSRVSTGTANTPTATSTGATWAAVNNQLIPNSLLNLAVLRTMVSSDQTGAVTMDYAGQTQILQLYTIVDCSGVDTSGTNGSGAVVTSNTNSVQSATSLTCTFAAYSSSSNRPVVGFGSTRSIEFETRDWTNINSDNTSDGGAAHTAWRDATDDTTATDGYVSASAMTCVGVEVKAGGLGQRRTLSPLGGHSGGRQGREEF